MEVEGSVAGCFSDAAEEVRTVDQEPSPNKCSSGAAAVVAADACFDCSICLDLAVEPVVTLCGHLYCCPCICKWMQVDGCASPPQCPVCKAPLSRNALVPLYGRGKGSHQSLEIPSRPSVHHAMIASVIEHQPPMLNREDALAQQQHQHYYPYPYEDDMLSSSPLGSTSILHSMAGLVLGGMAVAILTWVFRNHELAASMSFSSPYLLTETGNNPRLRRQELRVEDSLHRLWIFLFCCALLCLLFF